MGLPERVPENAGQQLRDAKSELLDESSLFPGKAQPYREVEFQGADGVLGKVLIQALGPADMDEINHVQNQPVKDGHGKVIEEANRIGFEAKIVAKALRRPNKQPLGGAHWLSLAEKIQSQWLAGSTKKVAGDVLDLSGYGQLARSEEKKGS